MMESKNAYRLINPLIVGSFPTLVRASNSFSAGKKLYDSLSDNFVNHVEGFYMTIQNVFTKKLTHFKITEKRDNNISENGTTRVDYELDRLTGNLPIELEEKLINEVSSLDQTGGKKSKRRHIDFNDDDDDIDDFDDDSTSDSSEDYYSNIDRPISKFVYFYLPYYGIKTVGVSPLDVGRIFLPMFSLPINPILEIRYDLMIS